GCYTTWAIEILPYIEQPNLYKKYDQSQQNHAAVNALVGQEPVATYQCPSDVFLGLLEVPASGPRPAGQLWMHGSYRANSGRGNDRPASGGPPYRGFWDTFEP